MNKIMKINKNNNIIYILVLLIFIFFIFYFTHNLLKADNTVYLENFDNNNSIPKIIIQTWKTKMIPEKYKNDVQSCKTFNPNYEYKFFSDEDIDDFLSKEYPEWFKTYNKFPVKIQKIDFFRYVAIYHFGGFYLDLDMTVFKSFDDLLNNECVFPIDQNINCSTYNEDRFKEICEQDKSLKIILGQYAFAARKENKFIKMLIDNIHNNIDDVVSKYNDSLKYVYITTGPDYVTDVYIKYMKDINNQNTIKILHHFSGQYFGEYAKHNFFGTWKHTK